MSKYNEESKRLLEYIGGKENIISVTHCATRLRFALVDDKKADIKKIGELETVKGTFVSAGQFQVIIGNDVADFYKTFINTAGLEMASKAEVKKEALKKQSFIQKMIAHLAEIFVPLLPAIIAGGLILGFRNILGDMKVFGNGTQSLTELHAWAATLNDFLWWFGNAIFPFLPALVAWSTVKKFGGTEVLGIVLGIMLVSPEFFMNAYQYGSLAADHAALAEALEKGNYIWHIFGLNIAKVGYQAQVLPAIFSGITLCYIEKWFTKRVPEILKLVVVPFMALFITGILTVTIIGPAAREIGNYIALIFKTLMLTPGLKYLGGFAFGLLYAPLVVTGLHHTFLAVDFQLIADPALQGTMIWPMIALSNIAQSGAVAATYFIYKKDKKQESLSASATISAWLGVTEPAMFGANLKYMYPFMAAITASAVAGLISAAFGVLAGGVGIGGLPAILAIKAQYWPGYILAMAVALFGSFFLTFVFKKIYDKKQGFK